MNKIEKIILAAICGAVLLTWYLKAPRDTNSDRLSPQEEQLNYIIKGSLTIPKYEFLGNQNQYVVSGEHVMVGKDYIVTFESKKLESSEDFSYQGTEEYLKFAYKRYNSDEPSIIVSLSEIANSYKDAHTLYGEQFLIREYEKDFLVFYIKSKNANELVPLAYDLVDEKILEFEKGFLSGLDSDVYESKKYGKYFKSIATPIIKTNFSEVMNVFVNSQIILESDIIKTMNNHLLEEYPFLKEELSNNQILVIQPRPNMVTPEEWFNQTLHWFSPVDGEPLTVHLIYENDGDKGYPIRSYADYLKATEDKTE